MRLTQELNEAKTPAYEIMDLEDFNDRIQNNCKSYLKLIKGKMPMVRGMSRVETSNGEAYIGMKMVRKDRKPYGMSTGEADAINKMLQMNGHARRDRSVLCTSNIDHVDMFGVAYHIWPKDKMRYTWIETEDINLDSAGEWSGETVDAWYNISKVDVTSKLHDRYSDVLSDLTKPFEEYFHTNKGFNTAYNKGYEMWFETDAFYFARASLYYWHKNKQIVWE